MSFQIGGDQKSTHRVQSLTALSFQIGGDPNSDHRYFGERGSNYLANDCIVAFSLFEMERKLFK